MGVPYPVRRISSTCLQAELFLVHAPVGRIEVVVSHQSMLAQSGTVAQESLERFARDSLHAHERQWNELGEYLVGVLDTGD